MKRQITLMAMIAVVVILTMSACGTDDIDISGYADQEIVLTGLSDKEEVVTVQELKSMDHVTIKAESTSDKIGVVRATGPWLDTLLEKYGKKQEEFSKIKLYAPDEYDITLPSKVLEEDQIILAFGIDGKPLEEKSKPIRVIIPDSDSAYWIRMVEKIEFIE